MRRRFRGAPWHEVEDAVSSAMVFLLDWWVTADHSIDPDNPERTFWFAVTQGTWSAKTFLAQSLAEVSANESLDNLTAKHVEFESLDDPEEAVVEDEERRLALGYAAELEGEGATWLRSYLSGETERTAAEAAGVNQSTVNRQRRRVIENLRSRARAEGVVE